MRKEVFTPLAVVMLVLTMTACTQHPPSTTSTQPQADAPTQQFIARGNEPFWTLKVNGATLALITPDHLQGKPLHADSVISGDSTRYSGTDQGTAFTLVIEPTPCTDSMSGEEFSHTSRWTYAGETHLGCAARVD
ncbi:hypothetical protein SB766_13135 [Pseudomonas sp. SIMBA_077]